MKSTLVTANLFPPRPNGVYVGQVWGTAGEAVVGMLASPQKEKDWCSRLSEDRQRSETTRKKGFRQLNR